MLWVLLCALSNPILFNNGLYTNKLKQIPLSFLRTPDGVHTGKRPGTCFSKKKKEGKKKEKRKKKNFLKQHGMAWSCYLHKTLCGCPKKCWKMKKTVRFILFFWPNWNIVIIYVFHTAYVETWKMPRNKTPYMDPSSLLLYILKVERSICSQGNPDGPTVQNYQITQDTKFTQSHIHFRYDYFAYLNLPYSIWFVLCSILLSSWNFLFSFILICCQVPWNDSGSEKPLPTLVWERFCHTHILWSAGC